VVKSTLSNHISPEIERRKKLEIQEKQEEEIMDETNTETETEEDVFSTSLRRSIRTLEVMGIIIKNRMGSLEKQRLEEILTEAININLRILTSFFDLIKDKQGQQEIVEYISNKLEYTEKGNKQKISMENLKSKAKKIFWNLNFEVISGFIIKTIRSIGSDKLQKIIEYICDKKNTPVHLLLKHGVFMWYGKNMQVDKIIKEIKKYDFSLTANEVLKRLIVYHCTLHNIDFSDKKKIEKQFGISSKALLKIEFKK
jgi:hypothetical protein